PSGEAAAERLRFAEVVVGRSPLEGELKAPCAAAFPVDGDSVGRTGYGCELRFAVGGATLLTARAAFGADNRCQASQAGAGVDGEQGVDARAVAAGGDVDGPCARRCPREPDRVAARIAGVVRLAGLPGGGDGRAAAHRRFGRERLGVGEIVVFRGPVQVEREDPFAAILAVDGDAVRGAGDGFELDLATHLSAGERGVVVAGDGSEFVDGGAGVDGEQG